MKDRGVNLLPNKARYSQKRGKFWQYMVRVLLGANGLMLGLVLLVLILTLNVKTGTKKLEKQVFIERKNLSELEAGVVLTQDLRYRLKMLTDLAAKRIRRGLMIREFTALMPDGVEIEELSFEGSGLVSARLATRTSAQVLRVEELTDSTRLTKDAYYKEFSIENINWRQGKWSIQLTARK